MKTNYWSKSYISFLFWPNLESKSILFRTPKLSQRFVQLLCSWSSEVNLELCSKNKYRHLIMPSEMLCLLNFYSYFPKLRVYKTFNQVENEICITNSSGDLLIQIVGFLDFWIRGNFVSLIRSVLLKQYCSSASSVHTEETTTIQNLSQMHNLTGEI